jgi:ubiquinone/menaquinone biosynthesis C-methylase UbiE
MEKPIDLELARLEVEYTQRASNKRYTERYSYFNEAALLHIHDLERALLALLKKHRSTSLLDAKILDVGCGSGGYLRSFLNYGALPANLAGIDLMDTRIAQAKLLHPGIDWRVGSAHELPYTNAKFDLVMSFVVFSSILDKALRQQIVDEMWRVLKPGGLLLLYDFMYSNPHNAAVRGINLRSIKQLFARPGVRFDFRRITLAPPLARSIVPHAYWLAYILQQLKLFNTHMLVLMKIDE